MQNAAVEKTKKGVTPVDKKSLKVAPIKVYVSDDYDMFTLSTYNREVSLSKKLLESVKDNDLTQFNPILVNDKLVIIDGQHRFMVCRELGIPIYFIISDDVMVDDASAINQATKNWSTIDHILHYYKRGFDTYIKLMKLAEKYDLHLTNLLALGKGSVDKNITVTDLTRAGKFQFRDSDARVKELLDNFQVFKEYIDFANTTTFFKAYIRVASLSGYSHAHMVKKLKIASGHLHRQSTQLHQINELLKLYNYGVQKNKLKLESKCSYHLRRQTLICRDRGAILA
jgi:hypothetical protein